MTSVALDYETLTDIELARRIAQRDTLAVRLVTRRNNQRLYRTAWSILKNRADAEDAVQDGYLKAFAAIDNFAGASSLSTWLTRIVLNEALGRRRSAQRKLSQLRAQSVAVIDDYRENLMGGSTASSSPEADAARGQVARLLEQAIADLPEAFRIVFMLREVEGLSVEETADALQIAPSTVKTRLLRARRRLQTALAPALHDALRDTFPFAGEACETLTCACWPDLPSTGRDVGLLGHEEDIALEKPKCPLMTERFACSYQGWSRVSEDISISPAARHDEAHSTDWAIDDSAFGGAMFSRGISILMDRPLGFHSLKNRPRNWFSTILRARLPPNPSLSGGPLTGGPPCSSQMIASQSSFEEQSM